jgi:hypothetical protein
MRYGFILISKKDVPFSVVGEFEHHAASACDEAWEPVWHQVREKPDGEATLAGAGVASERCRGWLNEFSPLNFPRTRQPLAMA